MARIVFILLCHKDPQGVIAQAERLTATGDFVSIHFDARADAGDFAAIRAALAGNDRVTFARRRVRCGWGEWSLVAATLEAVRAAEAAFPTATHFYMLSGDCMPVKSAEFAHDYLDADDADFIESFDFFDSGWIKTGIKKERLIYRHWFNERKHRRLFYRNIYWQRRLRLARPIPADLRVMIGSQWWCLRRQTIEAVLAFCDARRDILRFFRRTWIPDETFFQTLVAHLVPRAQIRSRPLTFLMFTDYGMPVTFYNEHYDLLLRQDYLFARKISPEALVLKERLGRLWQSGQHDFPVSAEGPRLHAFLTGRGRVGRRFAPRAWETGASVGRGRVLHVVVAKKWHQAKRLTAAIRALTGRPAVDYLFNEDEAGLPPLGGLEDSAQKRLRHRRATLRRVLDAAGGDRLVLCADPGDTELLADLGADKAEMRVLMIDSTLGDDYLRGHIARVGLAGPQTPEGVIEALVPAMRRELAFEAEHLRDLGLPHFAAISAAAGEEANAAALAQFLDLPPGIALDLARTPHLFDD